LTHSATLFWLTAFSLAYLLATSLVFLRNRVEFTSLRLHYREPYDGDDSSKMPKITVCVPARNEEQNIETVLQSVCSQRYPEFELLVLDDHSDDATPELIQKMKDLYPEIIKTVQAKEKPDDWLGKPWACQQLGDAASGDLLLFLDADTTLKPGMLNSTAHAFSDHGLDMITVWPQQTLKTFWERMVVPLIYYALLTLLPAIYVYRAPRWLPPFLRKKISPMFAAACGQCIGFTKAAYQKLGGHNSVKDQVVEDVELAKRAKRAGLSLRMFEGVGTISCRMYRSEKEIFSGLRKNFFAGFNRSILLFIFMAILHLVVFVLPFFTLPYSIATASPALLFLSTGSVALILLHRTLLAVWFRWNPAWGFLHAVSVLWFQRLGFVTLLDHLRGKKVKWKGRKV